MPVGIEWLRVPVGMPVRTEWRRVPEGCEWIEVLWPPLPTTLDPILYGDPIAKLRNANATSDEAIRMMIRM